MKKLITEQDIIDLIKEGATSITLPKDSLLTPLAKDRINSSKIQVIFGDTEPKDEFVRAPNDKLVIAIGSDHTGFELKGTIKKEIEKLNHTIIDVGTNSKDSCDYPDFAIEVGKLTALKKVDFGIMIDATGIPSSITANKIPGIRAATCYNEFSARSAREHNNANVLVLGAKAIGEETAKSILSTWFNSSFLGERHQRRLDKITQLENKFLKRENLS
ncbi:MAG: ribose 5-phosphate isomerase B [Melioribacteraceae bacterium]|nr:ribose 5-phosphate isomerase B [Melioribacteraceae bacterium]MCO6472415.1 ribose 5-phosphate isomerase B [Melioribacteraceae bacterium]MDD3558643.1 ribose 5-phosphate isomerase B [Melioribacteraceae bacterium]